MHKNGYYGWVIEEHMEEPVSIPPYQRAEIEFPAPNPDKLWRLEGSTQNLLAYHVDALPIPPVR